MKHNTNNSATINSPCIQTDKRSLEIMKSAIFLLLNIQNIFKTQKCLTIIILPILFTGCSSPARLTSPAQAGTFSCKIAPEGSKKPGYDSYFVGQTMNVNPYLTTNAEVIARAGIAGISLLGGKSVIGKVSRQVGPFELPLILQETEKKLAASGYDVRPQAKCVFKLVIWKYGIYKNSDGSVNAFISGFASINRSGKTFWTPKPPFLLVMQYSESAFGRSTVPRQLDEYKTQPDLYRQDFENAAKSFANAIVP